MLDETFFLLHITILTSVPYILAALGGTCSERSGVVNIALEGILLVGAFTTAAVTHAFAGDLPRLAPWIGLVAGVLAGMATSALHSLLTVTVKVDQIISGLAINLFAAGATEYGMHRIWVEMESKAIPTLPDFDLLEGSGGAILVNTLLGRPIVLATLLLVPGIWFLTTRTRFGLRLRGVGENPAACDTLGLSVPRLRYAGVLLSGALAGLGGAWLALHTNQFSHQMSAGRGYIAMAAVICGRWNPLGATLACLLFGGSAAFEAACSRWNVPIPPQVIQTLPYVLTLVAVAGFIGKARAPGALGIPYEK